MRKALVWFSCLALIGAMFMVVGCDDSDSTYVSPAKPAPKSVTTSFEGTAKATDGKVTATISTDAATGSALTDAEVSLAGATLTDKDGNPVTGDVKFKVTASDGDSEATFANGSFTQGDVTYKSLGAVSISATDANGNPVTISGPIDVKIKLAPGMVNPKTGKAVAEGDSIPIYGWGADGKLVLQGYSKVTKDASGNLVAGFTANQFMPNFAAAFGAEPTSP